MINVEPHSPTPEGRPLRTVGLSVLPPHLHAAAMEHLSDDMVRARPARVGLSTKEYRQTVASLLRHKASSEQRSLPTLRDVALHQVLHDRFAPEARALALAETFEVRTPHTLMPATVSQNRPEPPKLSDIVLQTILSEVFGTDRAISGTSLRTIQEVQTGEARLRLQARLQDPDEFAGLWDRAAFSDSHTNSPAYTALADCYRRFSRDDLQDLQRRYPEIASPFDGISTYTKAFDDLSDTAEPQRSSDFFPLLQQTHDDPDLQSRLIAKIPQLHPHAQSTAVLSLSYRSEKSRKAVAQILPMLDAPARVAAFNLLYPFCHSDMPLLQSIGMRLPTIPEPQIAEHWMDAALRSSPGSYHAAKYSPERSLDRFRKILSVGGDRHDTAIQLAEWLRHFTPADEQFAISAILGHVADARKRGGGKGRVSDLELIVSSLAGNCRKSEPEDSAQSFVPLAEAAAALGDNALSHVCSTFTNTEIARRYSFETHAEMLTQIVQASAKSASSEKILTELCGALQDLSGGLSAYQETHEALLVAAKSRPNFIFSIIHHIELYPPAEAAKLFLEAVIDSKTDFRVDARDHDLRRKLAKYFLVTPTREHARACVNLVKNNDHLKIILARIFEDAEAEVVDAACRSQMETFIKSVS